MKMDKVAGSGQDEFYTPRYAVEPIVQYLKRKNFKTIWCPFDTKDSQFVKVLKREKFKVIHTHISKGKDFFKIVDKGKVPKCDAIVSNPPYSKKTEVLTYLFELGIPFAMLLGIAGLFDSLERARLFSKHNFEILFLNPRVDYFSGEEGKFLKQPPFQSVYICHDILPKKLLFAKVNKKPKSARENPSSDWFLEPQFLKNDKDGYLINPDTNDIYWYHGACPSSTSDLEIHSEKESSTLYLTSSEDVADNIAYMNQYSCELDPTIYTVTVKIHADRFFDVRYALSDEDDRQFAMEMFQTYYLAGEITERDFSDIVKLIRLLSFEYYDFNFNEYPNSKDLLQRGFVGWIELETSSMVVKYGEPITLAILQDAGVEQYIRVVDMKGLPYGK